MPSGIPSPIILVAIVGFRPCAELSSSRGISYEVRERGGGLSFAVLAVVGWNYGLKFETVGRTKDNVLFALGHTLLSLTTTRFPLPSIC